MVLFIVSSLLRHRTSSIYTIKDMFRLKDVLYTLLLEGVSGNAAALISSVILYSAANIRFEGEGVTARHISEEEKLH